MPELFADIFISLDGSALGTRSPAYFGYDGPDLEHWITAKQAATRTDLIGRKTYEVLAGLPIEHRDRSWEAMTRRPTLIFSRSLSQVDWPGAELVAQDAVDVVRTARNTGGVDLRTVGSLSLVQQLLVAGLVDHLRLMIFPLVIGASGARSWFEQVGDFEVRLENQTVLDDRIVLLDYRPGGDPPYA